MESVMLLRLPQLSLRMFQIAPNMSTICQQCAKKVLTMSTVVYYWSIRCEVVSSTFHIFHQLFIFFITISKYSFLFSIMAPRRKWVRDWRCAKSSNQLVIKANCDPRSILGWKTIIVFISSQKPSDKILLWDSLKFRLQMEALKCFQSSISDPSVSGLWSEACDSGEKVCRCQTPSIGTW